MTRRWAAVALLVALVVGMSGCDGSTVTRGAPSVTVVTGLWPLASAVAEIGQGNVTVDDVVPAGSNPLTYPLDPAEVATVRHATVALEIGGGFQPSFERAAAGSAHTVRLLASPAASPYLWLNPFTMEQAGRAIAGALETADPKAAPTIRTGLDNLEAELGSLDDDYQSTLSVCPDRTLVTVDDAFTILHPRYPVVDIPVVDGPLAPAPSAATVRREVAAIRATGVRTIYSESFIPVSDIIAASAEAGVQVGSLDTLLGPPTTTTSWPYRSAKEYTSLMESNLSVITSALKCPNPDDN